MKQTTYSVRPESPATLTAYLQDDTGRLKQGSPARPALLVCPGGGYVNLSEREAEPVVFPFLAAGCNVFVLTYSTRENARQYHPFLDLFAAIRLLRERKDEFSIHPEQIFTLGFSAGGHLAAAGGVFWNHPVVLRKLAQDPKTASERLRPNGLILCYPVITAGPFAHRDSITQLCEPGQDSPEQRQAFSLEHFVSDATPPAFLWHTANDPVVPVQNSLLFAQALSAHRIPFELHIYPDGPHGLSLANRETSIKNPAMEKEDAADWVRLAGRFIRRVCNGELKR
ncbi:MAG: alpha/beta hydrolase [Clostridia bacterium]|nr:alpha/beta hydrolase [Clostridia bacterium]